MTRREAFQAQRTENERTSNTIATTLLDPEIKAVNKRLIKTQHTSYAAYVRDLIFRDLREAGLIRDEQ